MQKLGCCGVGWGEIRESFLRNLSDILQKPKHQKPCVVVDYV